MNCTDILFGSFACAIKIKLPYKDRFVLIDKCLLEEIKYLWDIGIKTTGNCCGHGRVPPCIGVFDDYIDIMYKIGYKNTYRPDDIYHKYNDLFIPKSTLKK